MLQYQSSESQHMINQTSPFSLQTKKKSMNNYFHLEDS